MKLKTFEQSLLEFDSRVLSNGTSVGDIRDIEILQRQLFFNQIFVSNTDEMFEKYTMNDLIPLYTKNMKSMYSNVANIIQNLMNIGHINFTREDSFEKRFTINEEIAGTVMTSYFQNINAVHYQFNSGELYYLSLLDDGTVVISYVDNKRAVYHKALHFGNTYWKTEECIAQHINHTIRSVFTIPIKVTTQRDNENIITKVEYSGDSNNMKKVMSIFGKKCLIISNPFIYTKDIGYMIESMVPKKKETQTKERIKIFNLLKKDKIIEYPAESFMTYLGFLKSAVEYPETRQIFITLYRIGKDPSIYYILKDAVERGIKVHVNMELCASGEEINKFWADELVKAGVYITTYETGVLKVHSKLTLVKMNNGVSLAQIGTGNYNSSTTSQYTDLSLITSNENICRMVEKLFDIFDGMNGQTFNEDFLVTRYNCRETLYELIDNEGSKGENGYICIKCNSLDDKEIIDRLDKAAANGCIINLIIRGVCTWVPEYDNVTVKSIIWDKLEHSRVFCFGNSNPIIYIGSLDLMKRKIDKRIETMVRITDMDTMLSMVEYINRYITATKGAWIMDDKGNYHHLS